MKNSRSGLSLSDSPHETTGSDRPQGIPKSFQRATQSQQLTLGWIGPTSGPLLWCFQQLSHFAAIRSWNHLEDWIASPPASRTSCDRLVVAMDWRDPIWTHLVNQLPHLDPTLAVCCLLPDNWLGHRRSHTPPISIPAYYWWQLQDGLIPWLLAGEKNGLPSSSLWPVTTRSDHWLDHSILQNKLMPPALSLFIAETNQHVEIYREFLQSLGGQTQHHQASSFEIPDHLLLKLGDLSSDCAAPKSSATPLSPTPDATFEIVWWAHNDIHFLTSTSPPTLNQISPVPFHSLSHEQEPSHHLAFQTRSLLSTHPNCQVGWITTAPNWNHFQLLQQLGFSRILVPPFHLNGLLNLREN